MNKLTHSASPAELKGPPLIRGYPSPTAFKIIARNKLIEERKEIGTPGFSILAIAVPKDCPFNCLYCFTDSGREGKNAIPYKLTFEKQKALVDEARLFGAASVAFGSYGEPLCYKLFFPLLEHIHSKGMIPVVFTNGALIQEKEAEMLYKYDASVILKINSLNEEIHDFLTDTTGAFKLAMRGLEELRRAGFKTPLLAIQSAIFKQNIRDIPALFRWIRENDMIPYIEGHIHTGRGLFSSEKLSVSPQELKELFPKLLKIDNEFGYTWPLRLPFAAYECIKQKIMLVVQGDGKVTPCYPYPSNLPIIGDVFRQTLEQILRSKEAKSVRNSECPGCQKLDLS
ncbi:MAG: radical SAM protein [Candidatus Micrarchaeota archaeon]